ncbi:hypothetical protein HWV62_6685 [Athelia sp. TMB]|nr:hypothetical protein HWV62_6685 [Athelia sp. TMB]
MVATQFLTSLLLASMALAAPSSSSRHASRLDRRANRQGQPNRRISSPATTTASNASHVQYSDNWAGAVFDSYPSGTFTAVTGTFTVPTPSGSSGAASAWVGIDGDTCESAILQTGVDFTVTDGFVSYDAWYEWYPDYAYDFSGIDISAGDQITLTVTASSEYTGTAVIENKSSGQTVTKHIVSLSSLCEENAEWIVEDFEEGSSLVPFADFGTVEFTGASATTTAGKSIGPVGATTIDIQQDLITKTSVSIGLNSVTVKYV